MRILCHHQRYLFMLMLLAMSLMGASDGSADAGDDKLPEDFHRLAGPKASESIGDIECACNHFSSTASCHHPSSKIQSNEKPCKEARIIYLIGIHNQRTLDDAVFLFRAIRDPRNTLLFHIDVKFDFTNYQNSLLRQEIEACPCGSHVEVASVHNATWSAWSMNLPTLWGLEKAVNEYSGKWDVFVNLSGDTLPVYTADRISRLFGGPLSGINFITSTTCETGLTPTPMSAFPEKFHKRSHYSQHPAHLTFIDEDGNKHTDVTLEIFFGSQWMALLPQWCERLIKQMQRPDSLARQFRDYLISTRKLMADETFIPSLIMYLQPETTPKIDENGYLIPNVSDNDLQEEEDWNMYAIRYERMDEHAPNSRGWFPTDQRYEVPSSSSIGQTRPWGPYYLGVYDLKNIQDSGALYVRKVASEIDPNMFHILPVDKREDIPPIKWPKEIQVSPVPDWEKLKAELIAKHRAREKQKNL